MFQKTDSIHIYILMVYIDFYVKFSEWGPNYLVIAARSIDCLENNVALRYYTSKYVCTEDQMNTLIAGFGIMFCGTETSRF